MIISVDLHDVAVLEYDETGVPVLPNDVCYVWACVWAKVGKIHGFVKFPVACVIDIWDREWK